MKTLHCTHPDTKRMRELYFGSVGPSRDRYSRRLHSLTSLESNLWFRWASRHLSDFRAFNQMTISNLTQLMVVSRQLRVSVAILQGIQIFPALGSGPMMLNSLTSWSLRVSLVLQVSCVECDLKFGTYTVRVSGFIHVFEGEFMADLISIPVRIQIIQHRLTSSMRL